MQAVRANSPRRKLILFCATLFIIFLGSVFVPRVSMPLVVAFIFSIVLQPVIPYLRKLGISFDLSIVCIFLILGVFLVYPIFRVVPTITEEAEKFSSYIPKIEQLVRKQYNTIGAKLKHKLGVELPRKQIDSFIFNMNSSMGSLILKIPNVLASFLEWLFLVPLFLFFFLRDCRIIKRNFLNIVPNVIFERSYQFFTQFSKQIGDYIFAKFVEAFIIGMITIVGLWVMDIRFAITLGFFAAIASIIPYLGPILGVIPGLIIVFIDFGMSSTLGAVFLLYAIANIIDMFFIFPILVPKIVNLHPVVVVVSIIIGSQYLGVFGMVVSIPLAAAIKLLLIEIYRDGQDTMLLVGDE